MRKDVKGRKEGKGMDEGRRDFLKKAVVGSVALAMVPTLLNISSPAAAQELNGKGRRFFQFVAFSKAGIADRVAMNGEGNFKVHSPSNITGEGEGSWTHFNPASPVPPLFFGKWRAKNFVSYDPSTVGSPFVGIFGRIQASRVVMNVDLLREFPTTATIPAVLKIVCNIGVLGSAGSTSEPEGYILTIPGTPFADGGTPGPFKPFFPLGGTLPFGLTHTSIENSTEEED